MVGGGREVQEGRGIYIYIYTYMHMAESLHFQQELTQHCKVIIFQ